jgi:HD-like signal output (HDOD) protein
MSEMPRAVPIRATPLVSAGAGQTCVVLHRSDQIFDLVRFNQQNATRWRALPTEDLRGLSWPEVQNEREIWLDRGVLEAQAVAVTDSLDPDDLRERTLKPSSIRHTGTIDCAFDLPVRDGSYDDLDRIHSSITTFTRRRLLARLDETLEIPPLPAAAQRILALKSNPDYSLKELVKLTETDPSIAARVMSWANSAFYAANPPPRSLTDAIMRVLGTDLVMNLALGLALAGSLRLPEHQVKGVPPFWTEAVYTATAVEALARRGDATTRAIAGFSYLTGLLANYGTLVLGHVFPPQYGHICLLQEANPGLPAWMIDEHVLQVPREALASALFDQWGLPEEITVAVREQHNLDYSGPFARVVHLLQAARSLLGYGSIERMSLGESGLISLGLGSADLDQVGALLVDSRDALDGLARAVA